ncbi:MAG: cupin domain-containing protein [Myxococcales bacterium]|nr:cupin domain-containing protein [Myxococcales bacterium]
MRDPIALVARDAPPRVRPSVYPAPFAAMMEGRTKHPLGDLFGLTRYGVNLVRLAPGARSALRHHHSAQDEFVFVLEGTVTLITDAGPTALTAGMCAGFAHGDGDGHQLVNRSEHEAVYLEVGDRTEGDQVVYPDDDLAAERVDGAWVFTHKDRSPYKLDGHE